jgi:hypothetical protein
MVGDGGERRKPLKWEDGWLFMSFGAAPMSSQITLQPELHRPFEMAKFYLSELSRDHREGKSAGHAMRA